MMGSRFKDRQLGQLIKQLVFFACYNPLADLVSLHSLRVAGKFLRQASGNTFSSLFLVMMGGTVQTQDAKVTPKAGDIWS